MKITDQELGFIMNMTARAAKLEPELRSKAKQLDAIESEGVRGRGDGFKVRQGEWLKLLATLSVNANDLDAMLADAVQVRELCSYCEAPREALHKLHRLICKLREVRDICRDSTSLRS